MSKKWTLREMAECAKKVIEGGRKGGKKGGKSRSLKKVKMSRINGAKSKGRPKVKR